MIDDLRMKVATARGAHVTLDAPRDMLALLRDDELATFELLGNGIPVITVSFDPLDPPMWRSRLYIAPHAMNIFYGEDRDHG